MFARFLACLIPVLTVVLTMSAICVFSKKFAFYSCLEKVIIFRKAGLKNMRELYVFIIIFILKNMGESYNSQIKNKKKFKIKKIK